MHIEALERQVSVCSLEGAKRLTKLDRGFWNVVSIHGAREFKLPLPFAKSTHYACFDDVEEVDSPIDRSARPHDLAGIARFIDALPAGPPAAPLLIHCQQGLSRSTAVALAWIYRQLPSSDTRIVQATDILLELRPQAKPNRLVLALALACFLPAPEARDLCERMLQDPRLQRNRFQQPAP